MHGFAISTVYFEDRFDAATYLLNYSIKVPPVILIILRCQHDEGINDTVTRSCQTAANAQQAQNRHMEYPQYVPDTGFEKSLVVETELAEELEMNSE